MWIVSLKRLREFWSEHERAQIPLRSWYTQVAASRWRNFAEIRATFPSADLVGNCTVFNIAGNHYRLITRVLFPSHKVFVLRVMTHREYDQIDWATQCGCYQPPPKRRATLPRRPGIRRRRP